MNERIKEIEDQAHEMAWQEWKQNPKSDNGNKLDAYALNRFKNKFAELIVRECISQLNIPDVPGPISAGLNLGKAAIKEHFGVE